MEADSEVSKDDYRRELGEFLVNFSNAETLIKQVISMSFSKKDHAKALRILDKVQTSRLADLLTIWTLKEGNEDDDPTIKQLRKDFLDLNNKRNDVVHSHWILSENTKTNQTRMAAYRSSMGASEVRVPVFHDIQQLRRLNKKCERFKTALVGLALGASPKSTGLGIRKRRKQPQEETS